MRINTLIILLFFNSVSAQIAQPIFPTSEFSGYSFGSVLAIKNNDVAVSSASYPFGGSNTLGKVYLFDNNNGSIIQNTTLSESGIEMGDKYGSTVSLGNDFLAVGAPLHNNGAVYLYKKVNGLWNATQTVTDDALSAFGSEVIISDGFLFASAAGKVNIYKLITDQWIFQQQFDIQTSKIIINNGIAILGNEVVDAGYISFSRLVLSNDFWNLEASSTNLISADNVIYDFAFDNGLLYIIAKTTSGESPAVVFKFNFLNNQWISNSAFTIVDVFSHLWTRIEVSGENMYIGSTGYILQQERKFTLLNYRLTTDGDWNYFQPLMGTQSGSEDDYFGSVIASDNDQLLVGSPLEGIIGSGKAYVFNMTLGTKQFSKNQFTAYPNPTSDLLNIEFKDSTEIQSIEIISLTGKLLKKVFKSDKVSMQDLATGMYLAKITALNGSTQTLKVVKN